LGMQDFDFCPNQIKFYQNGLKKFARGCGRTPASQDPTPPAVESIIKGRVHCFSTQIVVSKCFLLNHEKNFGVDPSCRFREKRKNPPLILKSDVTDTKARLL